MSGASAWEGRAVVDEIIQALGDDVAVGSEAWWQYALALKDLGDDCARQLVGEVSAVEAAGGMTTQDGSRRRTRGGVFFVLAYERLGAKRAQSVRWRALRRVHEDSLRRFLQLLALALPASSERPAASAEPAAKAAPRPSPRASKAAGQAGGHPRAPVEPRPPARAAATGAPAAKPAQREEPEVEVLVVRRRPTTKPGGSTPRAAR